MYSGADPEGRNVVKVRSYHGKLITVTERRDPGFGGEGKLQMKGLPPLAGEIQQKIGFGKRVLR